MYFVLFFKGYCPTYWACSEFDFQCWIFWIVCAFVRKIAQLFCVLIGLQLGPWDSTFSGQNLRDHLRPRVSACQHMQILALSMQKFGIRFYWYSLAKFICALKSVVPKLKGFGGDRTLESFFLLVIIVAVGSFCCVQMMPVADFSWSLHVLFNCSYVFWMGDLNFRIEDISNEEVRKQAKEKNFEYLSKYDQVCRDRLKAFHVTVKWPTHAIKF